MPGRALDDNAHVMMRFKGGAKGILWCSQVATGNENALKVRVYGTKAGIEWSQQDPNYLWVAELGKAKQLITRNGAGANAAAGRVSRIPGGHPEGYLEASPPSTPKPPAPLSPSERAKKWNPTCSIQASRTA
ncbi:hypothetical protein GCM10023069_18490 [Shinella granuli]